jgi:predicted acyl esterase
VSPPRLQRPHSRSGQFARTFHSCQSFNKPSYRNGLARAEPIPPDEPIRATVTFKPQDQTFEAGHRIGVILQGSNTVWAVLDDPGATYTVTRSALELPLS